MKTMVMEVTPELAQSLLEKNSGNRHLKKGYVSDLANAMIRGEWKPTHQGLAISTTGRLLDGQHRCAAVIQAGVSVNMTVTYDVPDAAFHFMDIGMKRSVTDLTGIPALKVACLRWFFCLNAEPFFQRNASITSVQIEETNKWAGPWLDMIMYSCGTTRKHATTAPIVTAAAIRAGISPNPGGVCDAFRAFVLLDYADMPPSVQSLERSISQGTVSARGSRVALYRAYQAFGLDQRQKIAIKSEDANLAIVQSAVRAIRAKAETPSAIAVMFG